MKSLPQAFTSSRAGQFHSGYLLQLAAHNTFVSEFQHINFTQVIVTALPELTAQSRSQSTFTMREVIVVKIIGWCRGPCELTFRSGTTLHDDVHVLARRSTTSMVDSLKDHIQNDVSGVMPSLTITTFIQIS